LIIGDRGHVATYIAVAPLFTPVQSPLSTC
jgi:hypothetical protein